MLRFALSPTDEMNIGDLRIALLNYIVSQQKKEDLIVRIEDTDVDKNIEGKDQEFLSLIELFGIKYTQTIYQSQQYKFHSAMALQLMHEKEAFSCFCSDEWISKKQKEAQSKNKKYCYDDACRNLPAELVIDNINPFRVRINRPKNDVVINDLVKGEVSFSPDDVDSFTILNQDKTSTNNFAVAVDDMISDISIAIRDEKYFINTPKQVHIRESLGYNKDVEYAHIPSIVDSNSISVKSLLEQGFLPEAIINYLLLLGNKTPTKIFSLDDAISFFDLKSISNSPTHFEMAELKSINHEHLKSLDAKELSRYVGFADIEIGELARIYLDDVATTKELKSKIKTIFSQREIPEEFRDKVQPITDAIKSAPHFEEYDKLETYVADKTGLSKTELYKPLYYLLTGAKTGPDIKKIYKYLKNYIGEIIK
jgi:glutamyl-tRNA synthetase